MRNNVNQYRMIQKKDSMKEDLYKKEMKDRGTNRIRFLSNQSHKQ